MRLRYQFLVVSLDFLLPTHFRPLSRPQGYFICSHHHRLHQSHTNVTFIGFSPQHSSTESSVTINITQFECRKGIEDFWSGGQAALSLILSRAYSCVRLSCHFHSSSSLHISLVSALSGSCPIHITSSYLPLRTKACPPQLSPLTLHAFCFRPQHPHNTQAKPNILSKTREKACLVHFVLKIFSGSYTSSSGQWPEFKHLATSFSTPRGFQTSVSTSHCLRLVSSRSFAF